MLPFISFKGISLHCFSIIIANFLFWEIFLRKVIRLLSLFDDPIRFFSLLFFSFLIVVSLKVVSLKVVSLKIVADGDVDGDMKLVNVGFDVVTVGVGIGM